MRAPDLFRNFAKEYILIYCNECIYEKLNFTCSFKRFLESVEPIPRLLSSMDSWLCSVSQSSSTDFIFECYNCSYHFSCTVFDKLYVFHQSSKMTALFRKKKILDKVSLKKHQVKKNLIWGKNSISRKKIHSYQIFK